MIESYRVDFTDHTAGCVEVDEGAGETLEQVLREMGREAVSSYTTPYPSEPRLRVVLHEKYGKCPSFCYTPGRCKGLTACPNSPACTS